MAKRKTLKERFKNVFTTSDINFLKKNAQNFTLAQLSGRLGHPVNLISRQLKTLEITALDKVAMPEEDVIEDEEVLENKEEDTIELA